MLAIESSTIKDQQHFLSSQGRIMDPPLLGIVVNPMARSGALRTQGNVPAGGAIQLVETILFVVSLTNDVQLLQSKEFRHQPIFLAI